MRRAQTKMSVWAIVIVAVLAQSTSAKDSLPLMNADMDVVRDILKSPDALDKPLNTRSETDAEWIHNYTYPAFEITHGITCEMIDNQTEEACEDCPCRTALLDVTDCTITSGVYEIKEQICECEDKICELEACLDKPLPEPEIPMFDLIRALVCLLNHTVIDLETSIDVVDENLDCVLTTLDLIDAFVTLLITYIKQVYLMEMKKLELQAAGGTTTTTLSPPCEPIESHSCSNDGAYIATEKMCMVTIPRTYLFGLAYDFCYNVMFDELYLPTQNADDSCQWMTDECFVHGIVRIVWTSIYVRDGVFYDENTELPTNFDFPVDGAIVENNKVVLSCHTVEGNKFKSINADEEFGVAICQGPNDY